VKWVQARILFSDRAEGLDEPGNIGRWDLRKFNAAITTEGKRIATHISIVGR